MRLPSRRICPLSSARGTPDRFVELYHDDPAFKRWYTRLKSKAAGTQRQYLRYMSLFCLRFGYTPTLLYEARLAEATCDDPLRWGVIRDQILQVMREMAEARFYDVDDPWPEEALGQLSEVRALEPETCKQVGKAVTSFLETFGERMEIRLKAKDLPQGDSQGSRAVPLDVLREALKHGGREIPHRNVAILLHLKEWGPRLSDLGVITVGDYLAARARPTVNDLGEPFIAIKPERTVKEGLLCRPHLGPEGVEATDRYLEVERPGAELGEPLFTQWYKVTGTPGPLTGNAAGQVVRRMILEAAGPRATEMRWTPHSIRKTWSTLIQAGGMPETWAKYIQGKARDRYQVPEDLSGLDGDTLLMKAYVEAYDMIRLDRDTLQLREQVKRIEAEKVEDRRELQLLRMRLDLLEQAVTGQNKLRDLVKKLDKLK